jgi:hypothetical protein
VKEVVKPQSNSHGEVRCQEKAGSVYLCLTHELNNSITHSSFTFPSLPTQIILSLLLQVYNLLTLHRTPTNPLLLYKIYECIMLYTLVEVVVVVLAFCFIIGKECAHPKEESVFLLRRDSSSNRSRRESHHHKSHVFPDGVTRK